MECSFLLQFCTSLHTHLSTTETKARNVGLQFYLPLERGDVPAITSVEADTEFVDSEGLVNSYVGLMSRLVRIS